MPETDKHNTIEAKESLKGLEVNMLPSDNKATKEEFCVSVKYGFSVLKELATVEEE